MLQWWALQLSIYEYDIEYKKGNQIPQANFLSRYAESDAENSDV